MRDPENEVEELLPFVSGNFTQPSIPNFGKHNHAQMALFNTNTQG